MNEELAARKPAEEGGVLSREQRVRQRLADRRAAISTGIIQAVTVVGAAAYWLVTALMSMGGAIPDYGIAALLAPLILLHGWLISKSRRNVRASYTLSYGALVFLLCILRYFQTVTDGGGGEAMANISLVAFIICTACFAFGWMVSPPGEGAAGGRPITRRTRRFLLLWVLVCLVLGDYLWAHHRMSAEALRRRRYTATMESGFKIIHDGRFSPRWTLRFRAGSAPQEPQVAEIHASLVGGILLSEGREGD